MIHVSGITPKSTIIPGLQQNPYSPYTVGGSATITGYSYPQKPPCFVSKCATCQYKDKCLNKEE